MSCSCHDSFKANTLRENRISFILASGSPRRQQLLRELGYTFRVVPSGVEETHPEGMARPEVPEALARRKAEAVAAEHPEALVIAADTIVLLDGHIIEKPLGPAEATQMLQTLSGRPHTVISGVCLALGKRQHSFSEWTEVYFRPLSNDDIAHYVHTTQPFDKAGAYGIQDWIGLVGVHRIEGCYYNVMGLPASRLVAELRAFLQQG